jgi:hypothetical protein
MRAMLFQAHLSSNEVDESKTSREQRSSIVSSLLMAVPLLAAIMSASYSPKNYSISPSPAGVSESSSPVYKNTPAVTLVSSPSKVKLQDSDNGHNGMKSIFNFVPLIVSNDSPIEESESISSGARSSSNDSSTTTLILYNVNSDKNNDHAHDHDDTSMDITRSEIARHVFIPALLEVGTIVLFQSFGLPLLSRGLSLLRKGRWVRLRGVARFFSARFGKVTSRIVHFCKLGYKKTNASKIVTRTKKLVKHLMHHQHQDQDHDHDDEHNDHYQHDDEHAEHHAA